MSKFWSNDNAFAKAVEFLNRVPLIDCHNDLPVVIRRDKDAQGDVAKYDLRVHKDNRDTDIPSLRTGLVAAQIWAAFPPLSQGPGIRTTLEQIELIHRIAETYPDVFLPALTVADIDAAKARGKIASFIAVEGGVGLSESLELLTSWHRLGVRLVTLCHNESLSWVDSATDVSISGGLSPFGEQVVRECNRLGIIVDCAHVSHAGIRRVLDVTKSPIALSHSNAFALSDHPRNVSDDILDRIRSTRSMVMATFVPAFISQASRDWHRKLQDQYGKGLPTNTSRPSLASGGDSAAAVIAAHAKESGDAWVAGTLPELVDHIEYMANRAGVEAIGIGSDFYGGPTPEGLENVECFPHIFAEMIRRGWSFDALAKIASENFKRLMAEVQDGAGPVPRLAVD
ncbi:dipeptidase [Rhizobium sp. 18055]|uniref:dipeptidase n=1 Tax=Rhizobium sp. 18055 TaxID=2681403 RepID=UPI00135CEF39|nr:dipeptidase [Rhizobium sp. 18055]